MEHGTIDDCIEEWETLSSEYIALEKLHKDYHKKLEDLTSLQQRCIKAISHQRYRINILKQSLKHLDFRNDEDNQEREKLLQTDFIRRKAQLYEMENVLPKPNGFYLKIILGNINVSILDKNEKFRYKDEYEKFKMVTSLIALGLSIFNLLTNFRTMDLIHMFLLVWYYCTLTIRESILKVNGSRIKGWWRAHHFISTILSGVLLIWPNGTAYYAFRNQFMAFNLFISFVQYLQFMYQRGCLYRLKALGERPNMDVTVEGFHSWMWRGLGFLIPFLFVGYFWELYNAYVLYELSFDPTAEWHVITLSGLFMVLFLGNTFTTALVIPQKIKERIKFKYRFTRLDKYIWTHKKRRVSFRTPDSPQRRTPAARAASFSKKRDSLLAERAPLLKEEQPEQVYLQVNTGEQKTWLVVNKVEDVGDNGASPSTERDYPDSRLNDNDDSSDIEEEIDRIAKDIDFNQIDSDSEDQEVDVDAKGINAVSEHITETSALPECTDDVFKPTIEVTEYKDDVFKPTIEVTEYKDDVTKRTNTAPENTDSDTKPTNDTTERTDDVTEESKKTI